MGSFPIFLRFDSLGWLYSNTNYCFINKYIFLYKLFFFKILKSNSLKLKIALPTNKIPSKFNYSFIKNFIYIPKSFYHISNVLQKFFLLNKNVLFVDYNYNYNYLPITNNFIFKRSKKDFYKLLKYFNVGIVIYLDIKKKDFFLKKIFNNSIINICGSDDFFSKKVDFNLNLPNNLVYNYILYIIIMDIFLKTKNKYKIISGSVFFLL